MADENNDPNDNKNGKKAKQNDKTGASNEPLEDRESEQYIDAQEQAAAAAAAVAAASATVAVAAPGAVTAAALSSAPTTAATTPAAAPPPAVPTPARPQIPASEPASQANVTGKSSEAPGVPQRSEARDNNLAADTSVVRYIENNVPGAERLQPNTPLNQRPVIVIMKREHNPAFNPFSLPYRNIHTKGYETLQVGREPTRVRCPVCQREILTMVIHEPKYPKCLLCFLLCTLPCCCCCWPCVCLPYCMDSCQNANHYCPNCNAYIGTFDN